jgi:hypothetical protein
MITKMIDKLFQNNIYIFIIVIVIILLFMNYIPAHIAISLCFLVYIMIHHKELFTTIKSMEDNASIKEKIIEDNIRTKKELHWNPEIKRIVGKLHKYKKYNPNAYEQGHKYIRMYTYLIHDLSMDNINHYNPYFETAYLYYKESLNHFQSISISVPEETVIDVIKYNELVSMKIAKKISHLCKELQKVCFTELYNLSLRLDEKWLQNPKVYTKAIHMNEHGLEEYNKSIENRWSLY